MIQGEPGGCQLSLLYVEDDSITRELVSEIIPRRFPAITVFTAENGMNGLRLFEEHRPNLVITDINMPVMNGILMAEEMKKIDPELSIIAVTAYSETNYLLNAIEIGINHYVLKPIDYKMLFTAIEKSVASTRLKMQLAMQNDHIRKLSRAVEESPLSVVITDADARIEFVNTQFTRTTGYTLEEVWGNEITMLQTAGGRPMGFNAAEEHVRTGEVWRGELLNKKKDGELYWVFMSVSPIVGGEGAITNYVAAMEDITYQKRIKKEIEKLNAHLEERAAQLELANRELEAFSYTVSHDLRSPLTNINGYCQLLLEMGGQRLDQREKGYVESVLDETKRMDELIRTLLNFSQLARCSLSREKVDLSQISLSVASSLREKQPERRVSVMIEPGMTVEGDPSLLRVVLENLVGNAWKYTSHVEGAEIAVGRTLKDGLCRFSVRDNGIGFDMKQHDRLFEAFQRLDGAEAYEGFGIGLATVRRIIMRHGGRIWAEGAVGKGATFSFTLNEV